MAGRAPPPGAPSRGARAGAPGAVPGLVLWQGAVALALLALWEAVGRGAGGTWISRPSLVAARLLQWLGGDLYLHLATTLAELLAGLVPGALLGIATGLVLGRSPVVGLMLRPLIVALYSIPLISLAPLFIMFFGIGMLPKIVLVAIVVFFLLFFNTFSGVAQIDSELVTALRLMGARRPEEFRKVVAPAAAVWIVGGLRTAIPYALVATITGEMLAARSGLGFLLSQAGERFDLTGLYAVLLILMALGLALSEAAVRLEQYLLRWRHVAS